MGKLGATFGLTGWMHLQSYSDPVSNIFKYQSWIITKISATPDLESNQESLIVNDYKAHHKSFVVALPNISTIEQAKTFTNASIWIERSLLPTLDKDQYYLADLIGLTVIDLHGKLLGQVQNAWDRYPHPLLEVRTKTHERFLIPYLSPQIIKKVDLKAQEIMVDWEDEYC